MNFHKSIKSFYPGPMVLRMLAFLAVLVSASHLSAVTTYGINSTSISNYPASGPMFIINADHGAGVAPPGTAPYNRWFVTAQTNVTATTTSSFSVSLQVLFRLVDSTGAVVPCVGADSSGYVASPSAAFSGLSAGNYSTTRSAYLVPISTVKIDPGQMYKMEAVAVGSGRGGPLASGASGLNFRFIHFTGPNSADAPVNAVGYLEPGSGYAHTFAVQTDPANADFSLSVPYSLYRYDDPTLLTQTSNVSARFTVQLFDSAAPAVPIALANANTDLLIAVPNHAIQGFIIPSKASGFALLKFKPAPGVQLDSRGKTYFAKVALTHFEEATDLFAAQDNDITIGATRLLHFNGKLIFGNGTANPIETTFTSVTNNPALGALLTPTTVDTSLGIASAVVTGTTHSYAAGALNVSLLSNGNAIIRGASNVTLTPPSVPDRGSIGGVRFDRTGIVLDANGAKAASLTTILPAGMGWTTAATGKTLNGRFTFSSVALKQDLNPVPTVLNWSPPGGSGTGWIMEESKPMLISASTVGWTLATGKFSISATAGSAAYVRGAELNQLEASQIASPQKIKCSNEQYWRYAQNDTALAQSIQAGVKGGAEFTGGYSFSNPSGQLFCTHFPYRAVMSISAGQMTVAADMMVPSSSSLTLPTGSPDITMRWLNGCKDSGCGAPAALQTTLQTFTPAARRLTITADGGLVGTGSFSAGLNLRWGYIPSISAYAHRVVTSFSTGSFAMGGIFLNGAVNTTGKAADGPGIMLLTGVDSISGAATERPQSSAYLAGRANYAGYNVNLGADDASASGINGASTLTGQQYGPYPLKHRSKYYVRSAGVSGIHDKVASAPQTLPLFGYQVSLTNFGLSFLDNGVRDSRVNGRLSVPAPSDIFVNFSEMKFFCNGALDKAKVAASTPPQTLAYWHAPIDIHAIQFVQKDGCDVTEGFLTLGVDSFSSHIAATLSGTVGFLQNGNLINKSFSDTKLPGLAGLDSRFKMPKQVKIQGPRRHTSQGGYEDYFLTPVADAYLNVTGSPPSWTHTTTEVPDGFWNISGRLKVSFFESPKIHFQTTANRPPADLTESGPWQNSVIKVANGTWRTGPGGDTSFFNASVYHDVWNRGFPYPAAFLGSAETRGFYVSDPKYLCMTQHSWLGGAIHFQYKLLWNTSTRSFTSLEASESQDTAALKELAQQMVILKIDHRLPYLSAERAEMTFGASYAGIPKISVTNFVLNEIDDGTGIFKAATDALCAPIFTGLDDGLDSLAKTLNDQTRDLFTAALDPIVKPLSDDIYQTLKANWQVNNWTPASVVNPRMAIFRNKLKSALKDTQAAVNQFQEIEDLLQKTQDGLDLVTKDPDGFLALNQSGDIELVRNLSRALINLLSKELGGSTNALGGVLEDRISALVDPLIKDAQPTLRDIRLVLVDLNDIIAQVHVAVKQGGALVQEISDIIDAADSEINGLTDGVNTELTQYLGTFSPIPGGKNFLARSESEIRQKIENAIYDRFFGTALLAKIQTAIKQQLQDAEVAIHSAIDSVFGEINKVIKKALSELFSEVDDTINDTLGEIGKYLGSGSVIGSATFNGDALRRLRMDGKFDFKVPDDVHIEAFLEINQYTSKDTAPGCTQPVGTESLTEVTIGALNVPTDFISPGVKLNLDAKFSFKSQPGDPLHLVGLGGGIVMAEGSVIDFEAFKITKLAVGVAFSSDASYFSAAMAMKMQSWGGTGGVFFGKTCTLDPIRLWDPFAAKVLGEPDPSFSGVYVYGEVHIPVAEVILGIPDSCFFSLTADAGVGFFIFAEGPSFGARMGLGIDGEVLCLLGISGRVDLLGGKIGGQTKLSGTGEVCATVLFVDVCKDISIETSITLDGSMKGTGEAK